MIHNLIEKLKIYCHTDPTDLTDFDGCSCNCCRSFVVLYVVLRLSKLSRSPASISTQNHFMLLFHLQPFHRTWIRGIFLWCLLLSGTRWKLAFIKGFRR